MTALEEQFKEQIEAFYPKGLYNDSEDSTSIIYARNIVKANALATFKNLLDEAAQQLIVTTATEDGLTEWETFLDIPVNSELSNVVRRANIISKLSGTRATVATIKAVATAIVGNDAQSVDIIELYTISSDPDDVFTYKVQIYKPTYGDYEAQDLVDILEVIHPAHCNVIVEIIPGQADAFGVTAEVDYGLHDPFMWGDADAPDPSDTDWFDKDVSTPLEGYFWQSET